MRVTNQSDGLECVVSSDRRSGRHLVGLVFAYPMFSNLGMLNICLSPYPLRISLAIRPQFHSEVLGRENPKEVRHPLQLLHRNGCSNLTMSQLCCRKEEGSILMTRILKLL